MTGQVDTADLGVVILSYGHDHEFAPLLDELLSHHGLRPQQVTVAHNPFDAEDPWTPEVPEGVGLLRLDENRGYAGGMNAATRASGNVSWQLLLTHDARLGRDAVAAMLTAGRQDPRIGVVGPRLMLEDGTTWSTGVRIRGGVARHITAASGSSQPADPEAVDGTILLVRSELLRSVGGFEERFFMYWEETEFCLRARRAGWRVVVAPDAVAVTRPGATHRHAVHAYLLTRNGLAFGWADAGAIGVGGQLLEAARRCLHSLPSPIRRHWRDRGMWRVTADRSLGTAIGVLDFVRRRWDKPPALLRRRSDVV